LTTKAYLYWDISSFSSVSAGEYHDYTMKNMSIDRQRLGKHIPEAYALKIGHLLLGNGCILDKRRRCFPWCPCRGVIRGQAEDFDFDFDLTGRELGWYKGVQRSSGIVQVEVRIVPVECPAGRRQCVR
jgi:hypothetical protein